MCGIAGVMARPGIEVPERVLHDLAAAIAHRGPDGEGRYRNGPLAMVQRRLAIIDLLTGDQPLHGPSGQVLIANGEIYNHVEWRRVLGDERFRTASDCEVPLLLHDKDGQDFARGLRGMYGIALYDLEKEQLFLSRDPFGIKPLYIAETGLGLAFASEPQALIAAGLVSPVVDEEKRLELLQCQFTTGRRTIFDGIERLLPGETVVVENGRVVERIRRDALPELDQGDWDDEEALSRVDSAMIDSVTVHERSDVPYGLFLSGGVDSSAILAAMKRIDERAVRAFTVGFDVPEARDERAHAAAVARAAGADHVEVLFSRDDFWRLLPCVARAMDDPAADYATLPTYRLAEIASESLKVVLSGEGGDELFAGYGRYRRFSRPRLLGGGRLRRKGAFDSLGILKGPTAGWNCGLAAAGKVVSRRGRSRLQVAQAMDMADWLPNDLLTKLDRCLMANGMEGRVPFLDPHIADVAYRLADDQKIRDGKGKFMLRRWLDEALPEADAFSKKRGFTVPVGAWIADRGESLGHRVATSPAIEGWTRPENITRLFVDAKDKRKGFAAWSLLFYALWYRVNIERVDPTINDIDDLLAA
ncbi:MAG: asparagine synthase (glutamine-hydrolyzing) [Rhodospirillaceae bacterium]|nr:asparagine synthase (glutamine-hydrolyzing) [Rhodospirillaceae bacterium]|tara:strand:+ start:4975 stop:6738 length:1764 start_codon:yes stop_codon:yes gene_type:complete